MIWKYLIVLCLIVTGGLMVRGQLPARRLGRAGKMQLLQRLEEGDRALSVYLSDRVRGEKQAVNDRRDLGLN